MGTFSIRARVKRSLSRNFWSMIDPFRTFRSLVRKKVSPRAFWPCWNSRTIQSSPSHSIVMPLRKSLGLTMPGRFYPVTDWRALRARSPGPAPRLDLGEDGIAKLLGTRHGAEQLRPVSASRFELDIAKAPRPSPQTLEGRQVLDPVDRDRSGKLGDDPLVQDDPLVGEDILVGSPGPVIEVEDTDGGQEGAEHQEQPELASEWQQGQDHQRNHDCEAGGGDWP